MIYNCLINGDNFLIEVEGERKKGGFYKWVTVEAADEKEAELNAVDIIRKDEKIRSIIKNPPDDPPKLFLDEIEESKENKNETGYIFY